MSIHVKVPTWVTRGAAIHRTRTFILVETVLTIAMFLGLVWLIHHRIFDAMVGNTSLSLALSLLVLQALSIITQLMASCAVKNYAERTRKRDAQMVPYIRAALSEHLAGDNRLPQLRAIQRRSPDIVERCLVEFLSVVDGVSRDTLSQLAESLRYVQWWEAEVRAQDRRTRKKAAERLGLLSPEYGRAALRIAFCDHAALVRTAACRALLRNGGQTEAEEVFRPLLDRPLVDRILLANELSEHALSLCRRALPRVLDAGQVRRSIAALEMALAWQRALNLPDLMQLASHEVPELRAAAIRLLPLTSSMAQAERHVIAGLQSEHECVVRAAAFAGARLGLGGSSAYLAQALTSSNPEVVRQACDALVQMGPNGRRMLEDEILKSGAISAAYALQALSRPRLAAMAAGGCA